MKSVKLAIVVLLSCASLQSIMAMEQEQGNQQAQLRPTQLQLKTMQEDCRNEIRRDEIKVILDFSRGKLRGQLDSHMNTYRGLIEHLQAHAVTPVDQQFIQHHVGILFQIGEYTVFTPEHSTHQKIAILQAATLAAKNGWNDIWSRLTTITWN